MSFSAVFDERLCQEKYPPPSIFVLFGATGNLAEKKIFPALDALAAKRLFHPQSRIVAVSRRDMDIAGLRKKAKLSSLIASRTTVVRFDPENGDTAKELVRHLDLYDRNIGRIYYLAVPPSAFRSILSVLAGEHLFDEPSGKAFRNLVLEKPPGYDLEDVRGIHRMLESYLKPHQIYLIDHYLGKDEVQNILTLRFANRIFSGVWNGRNIEQLTIAVSEKSGIGGRAEYFDRAGIIRDMFQSHLLIMLGLCLMPFPEKFDAHHINAALADALRCIEVKKSVFTGQYMEYRQTPGVPSDSRTLTCADIFFGSSDSNWRNTQFRLFAGKAMKNDRSFINIRFRNGTFPFEDTPFIVSSNELELEIKPHPGIKLILCSKRSGPHLCFGTLTLSHTGEDQMPSDGYQRLLLDCQNRDRTFFPDFGVFEQTGRICDLAEEIISAERVKIYSSEILDFSP